MSFIYSMNLYEPFPASSSVDSIQRINPILNDPVEIENSNLVRNEMLEKKNISMNANISTSPSSSSSSLFLNSTLNPTSQKVTVGVVIVLISIIAIIIISVVSWYFLQDPWEYPKNEESSLNKDYYKDQYSYYAWSHLHQSPYILLYIYAPQGYIHFVPQTVMTWIHNPAEGENKHEQFQIKEYQPIFEICFLNMSQMIGLSRLRKKGQIVNANELLLQWKSENFFPCFQRKTIDRFSNTTSTSHRDQDLPKEVKNEIQFNCQFENIPLGLLSFRYQHGDSSTEQNFVSKVKILSCNCTDEHYQTGSILFYISFVIESEYQKKFLNQLTVLSDGSSTLPTCDQLELQIYNPEWASIVFSQNKSNLNFYN